MRRKWVLLAGLLAASAVATVAAESYDPAYVDSPQSKAVPDPARTDALARGVETAAQVETRETFESAQREAAQTAEAQRRIDEQMKLVNAQIAAAREQQASEATKSSYADPPIGGRDLADELSSGSLQLRRPNDVALSPANSSGGVESQTGVRGQLGSALLQDAAGIVDAHTQRSLGEPDQGIYLSPPTGQ